MSTVLTARAVADEAGSCSLGGPPGAPTARESPSTRTTVREPTEHFAGWPLDDHLDLDIPRQRIVFVFGPNGRGRSTLLDRVAGPIPIDAGPIRFDAKSLAVTRIGDLFRHDREPLCACTGQIDPIGCPRRTVETPSQPGFVAAKKPRHGTSQRQARR